MKLLRVFPLFALFYFLTFALLRFLTARVQIGIVGGADGPTTIIVSFRNPVKGGNAS